MTPRQVVRAVALLSVMAACKPTWNIALDETAAGAPPAFLLTRRGSNEPAQVSVFRVDACAARGSPPIDTQWMTVAPDAKGLPPVARIVYGIPPQHWRSAQGPHPLQPGCYRAAVTNAPPLEFDVLPDGRTTARR